MVNFILGLVKSLLSMIFPYYLGKSRADNKSMKRTLDKINKANKAGRDMGKIAKAHKKYKRDD